MKSATIFVVFMLNMADVLSSQSCEYVQSLPVKYVRLFNRRSIKTFVSGECISDSSLGVTNVKSITVECEDANLRELKAGFVSDMATLESVLIRQCNNIQWIHAGAFVNLPKVTSISIEDNPQLTHVAKGLFDDLPLLNQISFKGNSIATIDDEAFANLHGLHSVRFSKNNLNQISRSWFTNSSNIIYFFIDRNLLEEIPQGMFKGWTKAKWFDLSSNNISVIHKEAFRGVAKSVVLLDLRSNSLKTLDIDSFPGSFIATLDISGNLLNYLPSKFIRTMRTRNLNIVGNPFKCACLSRIYDVVSDMNVWINCGGICDMRCDKATVPVCVNPVDSPDRCVETVDDEVTNMTSEYMKKLGYKDLRDWTKKCLSPSL